EVVADVARPARIHDFRDPLVGDLLKVVTAYPPARGVTRRLDYVEFSALRSVHGLVIKPKSPELDLAVESDLAVLSTAGGLTVSAVDAPRTIGNGITESLRGSFVDLARLEEKNFGAFNDHLDELLVGAAEGEGRERDNARLDLAQYYVANRFAHEALGVLDVLETDLKAEELTRRIRITRAIAETLASR